MSTTRRQFAKQIGGAALGTLWCGSSPAAAAPDLAALLEPIRAGADLPALAALCLKDGQVAAKAAVGVRKHGDPTPVTIGDQFHLGSCTKAMTAHLCARLMEEGILHRETTLAQALPEQNEHMQPAYRELTLDHLLSHRSGFSGESWLKGHDFNETYRFEGTPTQQREHYVQAILQEAPEADPGAKYIYSNRNFALAGLLAERATSVPWEDLLVHRVFQPLKITTAGYGAMGSPGRVDQPWQHVIRNGACVPIGPGPDSDNPAAIGPGGTVHMALEDWGKFVADHLHGLRGESAHLKAESYHYLHTPLFNGNYMGGWLMVDRSWGGGRVFTHTGTNTQNFAVVWMTSTRNFAVLIATNQGGDGVAKACDKAAGTLIEKICV